MYTFGGGIVCVPPKLAVSPLDKVTELPAAFSKTVTQLDRLVAVVVVGAIGAEVQRSNL